MNWLMANRLGHIAAAKSHGRLGVNTARYPVDVSAAIDAAGLALVWRPMPRLFGVYMEANGNRGVLVNSQLTRAGRRHTAAHELGHHELGHRPNPARECAIDASSSGTLRSQGEAEMTAEAFAAWFIMPLRAIRAAMADLGITRLATAEEAYQLSLRLGASFRGTCRHTATARLVTRGLADAWAATPPGRLKRQLGRAVGLELPSTLDVDVWTIGPGTTQCVHASVGDLLLVPPAVAEQIQATNGTTVASVVPAEAADQPGVAVLECAAALPPTRVANRIVGGAEAHVDLVIEERHMGIYLPRPPRASATEGIA